MLLLITGDLKQNIQIVLDELIKTSMVWLDNSPLQRVILVVRNTLKLSQAQKVFQSYSAFNQPKNSWIMTFT